MVDKSRVLYDLGLVYESRISQDLNNPIHLRNTVVLDHEVDGELLKKAWERTKRVYPIIDAVLGYDQEDTGVYLNSKTRDLYKNDHIYLLRASGGSNEPVKTRIPITPGTEVVGNRLIAISYYENRISINFYHRLVDGGGMNMVFNTLLYAYLALFTGHEDEKPVVELTEGRKLEEYYVGDSPELVFSKDYKPVPLYTLPRNCKGLTDPEMRNEDGDVLAGNMAISLPDFLKYCKENGANPSAMICTLLAKVSYALNPEICDDIVFGLSVAAKKHLGIQNSIANAVGVAIAYTSRDALENTSIGEVARKIRSDVDTQRTADYYITSYRLFQSYSQAFNFRARTVTYVGAIDVGDNNKHLIDLYTESNGDDNLFLFQLGDRFIMSLTYGMATCKYLQEFLRIFRELGIRAEITHEAYAIDKDASEPVL